MNIRTMAATTLYPESGPSVDREDVELAGKLLESPVLDDVCDELSRRRRARAEPVEPDSLLPKHVAPVRLYRGYRKGEKRIVECSVDGKSDRSRPVDPRHDLAQFDPTGFGWGGVGGGSAQLALALLADATGSRRIALGWYRDFKAQVVAEFPFERWEITAQAIHDWLVNATIAELRGRRRPTRGNRAN